MFRKDKSDFYICRHKKGVPHALDRKSLWWDRDKNLSPPSTCICMWEIHPPLMPTCQARDTLPEFMLWTPWCLIPFHGMGWWIFLLPKSQPARCKGGSEVCSHTLKVISYKSNLMKNSQIKFQEAGAMFSIAIMCQHGTNSDFQITPCQEANNINPNRMFCAGANKLCLVCKLSKNPTNYIKTLLMWESHQYKILYLHWQFWTSHWLSLYNIKYSSYLRNTDFPIWPLILPDLEDISW